ncbi:class I SAM-dependent methyltransferase [Aestuariibacter salexigens]|uniref:class I SAM-dependent methyltransferase n=1 Tax=Aestuariibacter salexigens TaxID=226010 RepID=UPI0003FEFAD0|nr:methyltransferase domain-containing protein [Aestuariibacter salexigens]
MKAALLAEKPRYPTNWNELPLGEDIQRLQAEVIAGHSRMFFGYHMVRLGALSSQLTMTQCPIKHVVNHTETLCEFTQVRGKSRELPFAENSVDAFVLAHELDFARDPHQILREVDRTIVPNGHVVICGFNPLSIAGLTRLLPVKRGNILHEARFFTCGRIKDWLHLLGFEVLNVEHVLFSSLLMDRRFRPDSRWQKWCSRFVPLTSAVYIIIAKKCEIPLSVVKPTAKLKPRFAPVSASMRQS